MKVSKFLQVCLGVGFVLLGIAAVLQSSQSAYASDSNNITASDADELTIENARKSTVPTGTSGKIQMSESGFVHNGNLLYHILVWNTETGKSKLYHFSPRQKGMIEAAYQIPADPMQ